MRIFVIEEYGYRHWNWMYPGTAEELVADWKAGRAPVNFFDPRKGKFSGELELVTTREELRNAKHADAKAHVHVEDDTWLDVGDKHYPINHEIWKEANENG
jgi:hypothetical protein